MKKSLSILAATVAALSFATGAQAQNTASAQPFIGLSGGYHDLGNFGGVGVDGAIGGIVAGVDVPIGDTLTIGIEGNYHLGTADIDSEYGVAARLGFPIGGGSQLFVRGGYQEVDFDLVNIAGGPVSAALDDTDGDYLVGAGGEFALGTSPARLRIGVDTIAFDTVRATAGLILKF